MSFRGCLEAMMELAEVQYYGNFGLNIDEFGAAYRPMGIHDRDEDEQDSGVADFQAERKRNFVRCFEDNMWT